ncbi:hsp70-Hsp90 organizing protein 2-like isoform X2 [Coregonus clupeaformis]|uniref:hsp70-Hsp90 organizing protein 2-like isoform X2 n=1 Tax=Coregonus clupeaformis TaxID=59861 RepID=UPI001E1C5D10|nr:hsp70-Hsp90 organizing protein 2-like isoform X2 [Coregonus clupeaformis]
MVGVMRFTWDIYRLLGLGSAPNAQRQEEMECGAATPDPTNDVTLSQEQDISGEDSLSEEEKAKRRAERRRAKRKRRRERKKLEQVKKPESTEQDAEDDDDDDDGESEEEEAEESDSEEVEEKEDGAALPLPPPIHRSKEPPAPSPAPSGTKGPQKTAARPSEEEPEWDVSSAFFANAASHIRPKGWTKPGRKSKENKENEGRTTEVNGTDAVTKRSASLTEKGIKLVQEGQYSQAIIMFTEAIRYDPKDYRFFGNRSYCYSCLEQYPQALSDAERSIQLAPDWPKGYFRKGSALIGMKRYSEAEKAMEQVLKLDKDCEEAVNDLFNCKVLQLMDLGFEEVQSVLLLERFTTLQAVLTSPEASSVVSQDSSLGLPGSPCASLWVGNVTSELTEKHLLDLFKTYGEIDSIRVLHERFCAFVNFKNANMASRAMEKLHGYSIENTRLVVRYPDHRTQRALPIPLKTSPLALQQAAAGPRRCGPVNGDECYFWRTTGCHFGDKCRYKHILEQRGKDRKPWQP